MNESQELLVNLIQKYGKIKARAIILEMYQAINQQSKLEPKASIIKAM